MDTKTGLIAAGLLLIASSASASDFGTGTATTFRGADGLSGKTDNGNVFARYANGTADVENPRDGRVGPELWEILCRNDAMTDVRRCSIFGSLMIVVFVGKGDVAMLCVSDHDFSGRTAMIRINDDVATSLPEKGCAGGKQAQSIFSRLKTGALVRTRAFKWPNDWPRDGAVTLTTMFTDAVELARYILVNHPNDGPLHGAPAP